MSLFIIMYYFTLSKTILNVLVSGKSGLDGGDDPLYLKNGHTLDIQKNA